MYPADSSRRYAAIAILDAPRPKPFFIIPIAVALFVTFGFGPNYLLVMLTCLVLVAGTFLLWRPGEAQILLFVFGFQWLQPTVMIIYANLCGMPVTDFMSDYPGIEFASMLALLGLLFLAIGFRLGAKRQRGHELQIFQKTIWRVLPAKWLWLHLVMLAASTVAFLLAHAVPGLSQPLLALANLKWATFLIFTISTFSRPDGPRPIWLALFGVEFAMSLGGYFSSFKSVFLYTLLAITAIGQHIKVKQVVAGAGVGIAMLAAGLYWTAIKQDYRIFISGGTHQQVVVVSQGNAILKIVELLGDVTSDRLGAAADQITRRFSEIDVFSAVTVYVPSVVEHEWGVLWLDAISRPFMPRILFPDKAIIDESALTNKYTGAGYAGMDAGTQVGMGYIADSYIDFGEYGMMAALLLFGFAVGALYRWLMQQPAGHGLLNSGLAAASFIQLSSLGASSAKLCGGLLVSVLVSYLVLKFVTPRLSWLGPPG